MIFGREKSVRGAEADLAGPVKGVRAILIVEDEPLVAFDNEHFLAHAGYTVVATVDVYDHAVEAIDAGGIDLVVADVNLSGTKSGVDVARHAHANGVPVLFVTGACPIDARHLALGCLAKPYSERDLLGAIAVADALLRGVKLPRLPAGLHLFIEPA